MSVIIPILELYLISGHAKSVYFNLVNLDNQPTDPDKYELPIRISGDDCVTISKDPDIDNLITLTPTVIGNCFIAFQCSKSEKPYMIIFPVHVVEDSNFNIKVSAYSYA